MICLQQLLGLVSLCGEIKKSLISFPDPPNEPSEGECVGVTGRLASGGVNLHHVQLNGRMVRRPKETVSPGALPGYIEINLRNGMARDEKSSSISRQLRGSREADRAF